MARSVGSPSLFAGLQAVLSSAASARVLLLPVLLFVLTLGSLLSTFGGHRNALLGQNPFCNPDSTIAAGPARHSPPHIVIQVSDLHINDIDDGTAKLHATLFAKVISTRWRPLATVLVATGDLVNAMLPRYSPFGRRSRQSSREWSWLNNLALRLNTSLPWMAVPGNHDSFGIPAHQKNVSHFSYPSIWKHMHMTAEGNPSEERPLCAIGIHSPVTVPLHRPFNFFGDAQPALSQLQHDLALCEQNHHGFGDTLVFGHHPTGIMKAGVRLHHAAQPANKAGSFARPRFLAYLSGHLHTLKGLIPGGMQVVAKSGVLELQAPDLMSSGIYRVIVLYNGGFALRDYSVTQIGKHDFRDAIVLSPPRAGLCAAGAGAAAEDSTHILIMFPGDVDVSEAAVYIDQKVIGKLQSLNSYLNLQCEKPSQACFGLYGVRWDPSVFREGAHLLSLVAHGVSQYSYTFSLDGSPDPSWKHTARATLASLLLLSDFASVALWLCRIGNVLSFSMFLPGLRVHQGLSLYALSIMVLVQYGPVIVSEQLSDDKNTLGLLTMRKTYIGVNGHESGADTHYLTALHVIWGILVPISCLDAAHASGMISRRDKVGVLCAGLYCLFQNAMWCLEIFGAYGALSGIVSPVGIPLLFLSGLILKHWVRH